MVEFEKKTKKNSCEVDACKEKLFVLLDSNKKKIAELNIYKTVTEVFLEGFNGSIGEGIKTKLKSLPMFGDCLETRKGIPNLQVLDFLTSSHKEFYDSQEGSYLWYSHDYKLFHPENRDDPNILEYMCSSDCPTHLIAENESQNGVYSALVLFEKEINN